MDSRTQRSGLVRDFDNYLIDTDHEVIVDVEATRSIRQAEIGSTKTMLNRINTKFDLHPERLIADTVYGSGPMLDWSVKRKIAPHIPETVKAGRTDAIWRRCDFERDAENKQRVRGSSSSVAPTLIQTVARLEKMSQNIRP